MEIIPSNRGGSKLCYQGYMYTKQATRKTNQWRKCVKRSSIGCRRNLSTTLQNKNPVPGQPHNLAPSDTSIKYSKTRNAMKTWQPTPEINLARSLSRLCSSVTTMSKPCCPVKKTPNAQFDTSVQLLQSQTTARMQKTEC